LLCCILIAMAATPAGAWLIGPSQLACCSGARAWARPVAQVFAAALLTTMTVWAVLWLMLPAHDLFQPMCRVGAFLAGTVN